MLSPFVGYHIFGLQPGVWRAAPTQPERGNISFFYWRGKLAFLQETAQAFFYKSLYQNSGQISRERAHFWYKCPIDNRNREFADLIKGACSLFIILPAFYYNESIKCTDPEAIFHRITIPEGEFYRSGVIAGIFSIEHNPLPALY